MKLKSSHLAIIILIFIFGGAAITSVTGYWRTTNSKVPATYQSGEYAGQFNPADIRGSYSFGEISDSYAVLLEDLGKAFGIEPERYSTFQCKELETLFAPLKAEGKEIGTASVRYFVALYKQLPIEVTESTYLPKPAVDILKQKTSLTNEQLTALEEISVDISNILKDSVPQPQNTGTETNASKESTDTKPGSATSTSEKIVKGTTMFLDLLNWGVKQDDIEKVLNDKMPNPQKGIKDYATEKGLEFGVLKEQIQGIVNGLPS